MILSVHQPNFVAWKPFFQKIEKSDIFVILTECQWQRRGYQNRFNMNGNWYTMSVDKGRTSIYKKKYVNAQIDWDVIKRRLPQYKDILCKFDHLISESLINTNVSIILDICNMLDIDTDIMWDIKTEKSGTERIIELCEQYKCDTYYSGISGKDYMDEELFKKHNIKLIYQNENEMDKKPILEVLSE